MKERGNERCQKKDVIRNYIIPIIGDTKLSEINTRFMEKYYQTLLKTPSVINPIFGANVKHFFTLLGKMFFTPYGKEFFTYLGKQIFTS